MKFFTRRNRLRAARDKGCAYLLPKRRPDGSFGTGPYEFYKTLTAFQVCGFNKEANALCRWIRDHTMTRDGDFGLRQREPKQYGYTYVNSWIIIGAHRLGQFDVSQKGMEFLMDFWDPQSGGFYSSPTDRDADTKQDVIYTGFCGLAALYTGRIEIARAVGEWMRMVMGIQPEFPQRLYTVYSRAKGLHVSPDPTEEKRCVVCQDAQRDQFFFQPGVAAVFLARLFQVTGEAKWLELAMEYMRFVEGANDYLFGLLRAGKVGWAASVLHTITRERRYKDLAIRIGDSLIACQSRSGYWTFPQANDPSVEITAEMIIWLDEIDQGVGGA